VWEICNWPKEFWPNSNDLAVIPLPNPVAAQDAVVNYDRKTMAKSRDDILRDKEFLAAESLSVANQALGYLQDQLPECSTRDLVSIFNAAVKTHRDIISDIVTLTQTEEKNEAELAKEYDGKVGELLKKLGSG
jgi:hypothetical protein